MPKKLKATIEFETEQIWKIFMSTLTAKRITGNFNPDFDMGDLILSAVMKSIEEETEILVKDQAPKGSK
jgi:hypothetical protein